jgi:hypothetical protein
MERYRVVKDVGLYYITLTVVEWLPVFIDETACTIRDLLRAQFSH